MLKGSVGKQLYKTKGPTQNRHSDSLKRGHLTHSQGMMQKGDDIAVDDDDDDVVRTSVLQN
jgi:hypothetical protein